MLTYFYFHLQFVLQIRYVATSLLKSFPLWITLVVRLLGLQLTRLFGLYRII